MGQLGRPSIQPPGRAPSTPAVTLPPGYAAVPVLSMAWTAVPHIDGTVPNQPPATPGSRGEVAAPHGPTSLAMGSIMSAEQQMVGIASGLVAGYNQLHTQVETAITTAGFWGEEAEYQHEVQVVANDGGMGKNSDYKNVQYTWVTSPDTNVQTAAKQFDQYINPGMTRSLRQAGDMITMLGIFINSLNLLGQIYAAADKACVLPPPGGGTSIPDHHR